MAKMSEPTKEMLLQALKDLLDGIDGYTSENGHDATERYWKFGVIEDAKSLVESAKRSK